MIKIFSLVLIIVFSNFALGATFGVDCADTANQYVQGPYKMAEDGTIVIDSSSKCKKSFKKDTDIETYSYECSKTAANEVASSHVITIKKDGKNPTEILNTGTSIGDDGKPYSINYGVKFLYASGSCEIDHEQIAIHFKANDPYNNVVNYDKNVCDKINNLPGLKDGDGAKCSNLLSSIKGIASDYTAEKTKSLPKGDKVELIFALNNKYSGLNEGVTSDLFSLVSKCQRHGFREHLTPIDCPNCELGWPSSPYTGASSSAGSAKQKTSDGQKK